MFTMDMNVHYYRNKYRPALLYLTFSVHKDKQKDYVKKKKRATIDWSDWSMAATLE